MNKTIKHILTGAAGGAAWSVASRPDATNLWMIVAFCFLLKVYSYLDNDYAN